MRRAIISSLALASLASVASTAAVMPRQLEEDQDRVRFDKEKYCGAWDRESTGAVFDLWFDTEAGWFLDHWLKNRTGNVQHNWLRDIESQFGVAKTISGADQCSNIQSDTCDPGNLDDCDDYFDKFAKRPDSEFDDPFGKSLFWIFENVKGMRHHLKTLRGALVEETIYTDLKVDEMIKNLNGIDEIKEDPFTWIMGIIGMGIQLTGLPSGLDSSSNFASNAKYIGPIASLFTGALNMIHSNAQGEGPQDVEAGEIRAALGDAFKKTHEAIDKNLRLMLGILREEEGEDQDTFQQLHIFNDRYDTSVGQFFGTGLGLLSPASRDFKAEIDEFRHATQSKVADHILSSGGHVLIGDDSLEEDECLDTHGARWLEYNGGWHCWFIAEKVEADGMKKIPTVDPEVYDSMEEYHLQPLERYYEAVIECGNNGDGEHTVDTSDMVVGKVPHCLFNLPVFTSDWRQGGNCGGSMGASCGMYRNLVDLE